MFKINSPTAINNRFVDETENHPGTELVSASGNWIKAVQEELLNTLYDLYPDTYDYTHAEIKTAWEQAKSAPPDEDWYKAVFEEVKQGKLPSKEELLKFNLAMIASSRDNPLFRDFFDVGGFLDAYKHLDFFSFESGEGTPSLRAWRDRQLDIFEIDNIENGAFQPKALDYKLDSKEFRVANFFSISRRSTSTITKTEWILKHHAIFSETSKTWSLYTYRDTPYDPLEGVSTEHTIYSPHELFISDDGGLFYATSNLAGTDHHGTLKISNIYKLPSHLGVIAL